ncbi:DUF4399 domain-containing protein [Dokdonella sp.]|uniref:DUF4399 domain-containing protein n=1 Tax=Dokdonella sp. TaxID=2291710 RepID=UPI0025BF77B1|nr:DUF4399 domain-containing protein [Dokdonella sp.]MBX3693124.1 DUF4399 domain-containing protein [Dokdonella sp.]
MRIELIALSTFALAAAFGSASAADAPTPSAQARTKSPPGVELYFISPKDGDKVGREVTVQFGLKGMGVAPAGISVDKTGHHHLLIDVDALPSPNEPIPADARHVHFGGGQTQTTVTLTPGQHTLQLNLGDALHRQFDPPVLSGKITITVE